MINDAFTKPELTAAWELWEKYRRERKLPKYKPIGLQMTIKHLEAITGSDQDKAIAFIHYSIAQNYQGIFPDPQYNTNGRATSTKGIHTGQDQLSEMLRSGIKDVYGK